MAVIKATGTPGSWFADVGGECFPCVHQERFVGNWYREPYVEHGQGKWPKFLDAIETQKRVVVTASILVNGEPTERSGYVAVYRIEDFEVIYSTMTFRIAERLFDLK